METEGQDFLLNWLIWDSFTWPWITSICIWCTRWTWRKGLHMSFEGFVALPGVGCHSIGGCEETFVHVFYCPPNCIFYTFSLLFSFFFYPLSVCQISELGQCHRGLRKKVERKWRQLSCMECACNPNHGSFADVMMWPVSFADLLWREEGFPSFCLPVMWAFCQTQQVNVLPTSFFFQLWGSAMLCGSSGACPSSAPNCCTLERITLVGCTVTGRSPFIGQGTLRRHSLASQQKSKGLRFWTTRRDLASSALKIKSRLGKNVDMSNLRNHPPLASAPGTYSNKRTEQDSASKGTQHKGLMIIQQEWLY